jgi:hypothetical protein
MKPENSFNERCVVFSDCDKGADGTCKGCNNYEHRTYKRLKSIRMIQDNNFPSSCSMTPEQKAFYSAFRADMKRITKGKVKRLELHSNHFDMYGFFETNSGAIYYISTGDLRWFAKSHGMLIRTAKSFEDYTGGQNCTIKFDKAFEANLMKYVEGKTDAL